MNSLMGEIQKLQDERTSDHNQHHTDESYIHRLLQTTDFCSRVVLNQVKEVMMDSVHNIKRFEEPALSQLRQKINMSISEGSYLTPLRNVTETVMDKTGVTPDITNLPQKIKDEMGHNYKPDK